MTVVNTRQGRTLFMHGTGRRPTVSFAMDRNGRQIDLKQKLAFDEVADMVDSAFARRCIDALRAKLEPGELERILKVMVDADLITKQEAEAVNDDVDVETNGPREEMATDAAFLARFPDMARLKTDAGYAVVPPRGSPLAAPMSASQRQEFAERFPHAERLKA